MLTREAQTEQTLMEVSRDEADEAELSEQETSPEQGVDEPTPDETAVLQARIRELEEQIAAREQLSDRIGRECSEFETYFPEISLQRVPDEVWGQVREGVPLSAAYALYEKKQQRQMANAQRIGQRGSSMTAGLVDAAGDEYFSPSQVRAMSPREVRQNYDRIFESMRHWQ